MKSRDEVLAASKNHAEWMPLLELAAREVFEMMLASGLALPEAGAEPPNANYDITSMVGLAGQLCGILSIRCGQKTAVRMAAKMLGTTPETCGQEVQDALGEVCNMVAGNFKNKISGLSEGCMLSVPTVITGNDYTMHSLADTAGLELPLLFDGDPLLITLEIHA
jgi:chemotaxis protein CheX